MDGFEYTCNLEGVPATIVVADVELDPTRPILLYARTPDADPARLTAIAAALAPVLERLGARPVGTIQTAGRFEWYAYGPSGEGWLFGAVEAVDAIAEPDVDFGALEDHAWSHYRDVLLPHVDPKVVDES